MNPNDLPANAATAAELLQSNGAGLLSPLLRGDVLPLREQAASGAIHGVVIGELLALADDGATPLVRYPGQVGTSAVRARSGVDLHGPHIGASVVLMFEHGDPNRAVVLGVLRGQPGWPADDKPAQVDVDADAHPGQTAYFEKDRDHRCQGPRYDYDCDGQETRQWTQSSRGGPACTGSGGATCAHCGRHDDFADCTATCR